MDSKIIIRISYKEIFSKSVSKHSLLSRIATEQALEFLVLINKMEAQIHKDSHTELKFIVNEWLLNSSKDLKDAIIEGYTKILEKRNPSNTSLDLKDITIINRIATLRTIEVLLSQSNIENIVGVSENQSLENLFKLYLLVNDEVSERQDVFFKRWLHKIDKKSNEIRFHLYLGLSHVDLTGAPLSKKLMSEVYKFVLFEKWMRLYLKHKDIEIAFLKNVNSKDWYDFFTKVFHINNICINEYKIASNSYPELNVVLDYFSNHEQTNLEWNELTLLHKKPLYKMLNGDYLILDFEFMMDKFFSGTYHDLIEMSRKYNTNFHLDYSKKFVEDALLVNSLRVTFEKSYVQFTEDDIKKHHFKGIESLGLPDFYLRNGNKVFLFECKNSYLSNTHKISMDCDVVEEDIKKKFVESSGKKKALKQLVSFIKNSDEEKYLFFDRMNKTSNINYYPIIVVTDETLSSIGFNQLFNEYFDSELDKEFNIKKRVKPLTIIHINDFLYYSTLLKKIHIIIDDYHNYVAKKNAIDGMISFSTYLDIEKLKGKKNFNRKSFDSFLKDSFLAESRA